MPDVRRGLEPARSRMKGGKIYVEIAMRGNRSGAAVVRRRSVEGARNGRLWGAVEAMFAGQTQGVKQR